MEGLFVKASLISILFFSFNLQADDNSCISHDDLVEIADEFEQFEKYVSNKVEYCESDLGEEWFQIGRSLATLLNSQPNEPAMDSEDGFTFKAIQEKDWWAYFTKRAERFVISDKCPPNVVAYVTPFWGNGTIYLCEMFFDSSVSSQASTMMHEVRHFDGHSHVTCSQGNEEGIRGACDTKITDKGSYAISVQTLVGMARSKSPNDSEKTLLEAEAIYMAYNKFNVPPKIKVNNSIIVSNRSGEVYNWTAGKGTEFIKQLDEPAIVHNSASKLTVYPLDPSVDAYRTDKLMKAEVSRIGAYAEHYNSEPVEERELYKSISYFGTGGLLKDNTLITLCNVRTLELGQKNLDSLGNIRAMLTMSLDPEDRQRESLLLAESGELYRFKCKNKDSLDVVIEKADMKVAAGSSKIIDSFGFLGEQFALLEDGTMAQITFASNVINEELVIQPAKLPFDNEGIISATPFSHPQIF